MQTPAAINRGRRRKFWSDAGKIQPFRVLLVEPPEGHLVERKKHDQKNQDGIDRGHGWNPGGQKWVNLRRTISAFSAKPNALAVRRQIRPSGHIHAFEAVPQGKRRTAQQNLDQIHILIITIERQARQRTQMIPMLGEKQALAGRHS